jgi:hypothetical protein
MQYNRRGPALIGAVLRLAACILYQLCARFTFCAKKVFLKNWYSNKASKKRRDSGQMHAWSFRRGPAGGRFLVASILYQLLFFFAVCLLRKSWYSIRAMEW